MNKLRALVVEDDERLAESISDILFSLGHDLHHVTNQADALAKLEERACDYVLLDLQIPSRPNRGGASHEYGVNLLRAIRERHGPTQLPVIIMTAHHSKCVDHTSELTDAGATDFIAKPFPETGRTLASVIQAVLERSNRKREQVSPKYLKPEKPFQGGELVFFPNRIELCGVAVVSSGKSSQMWTILDTLRQRLDERRYKAFPSSALADVVGCDGGQGSVAGSVRDFRRHVAELLGQELGLKVERDDVIETASAGYRLNARIVVKDLRNTGSRPATDGHPNVGRDPVNSGSDDPAIERRTRILAELRAGEHLRAPALADRLRCSHSTVKRELEALKAEGRITFVGPSKTGYYKLAETAPV